MTLRSRPSDEVSVAQIVRELDVKPGTVRVWLRENRLASARKVGRRWIVSRSEVLAMLEADPNLGQPKRQRGSEETAADPDAPRGERAPTGGLLEAGLL